MATLNVKDLPDRLYRRLRERARRNRRSMTQEVTVILSDAFDEAEPLSILELRGLGKAHWRGVDPARHVGEERRTWD